MLVAIMLVAIMLVAVMWPPWEAESATNSARSVGATEYALGNGRED